LEDLGVDGRIILKWIFKKLDSSLYWIDLAEDRERSRVLANVVTNIRVPQHAGNVLTI
jgi:hypothetical protein